MFSFCYAHSYYRVNIDRFEFDARVFNAEFELPSMQSNQKQRQKVKRKTIKIKPTENCTNLLRSHFYYTHSEWLVGNMVRVIPLVRSTLLR